MKKEVTLQYPLDWCGEHFEAVTLDFDKLTGEVDRQIRREILNDEQIIVMDPDYSASYQLRAAALAAGVDRDVIEAMSIDDAETVLHEVEKWLQDVAVEGTVITLQKPVTSGDKELTELELKPETLTGQDIVAAERTARRNGFRSNVRRAMNMELVAALAAKAAGVSQNTMDALSAADHAKAVSLMQNFLLLRGFRRVTNRKPTETDPENG